MVNEVEPVDQILPDSLDEIKLLTHSENSKFRSRSGRILYHSMFKGESRVLTVSIATSDSVQIKVEAI